jgi:hypothetical protein
VIKAGGSFIKDHQLRKQGDQPIPYDGCHTQKNQNSATFPTDNMETRGMGLWAILRQIHCTNQLAHDAARGCLHVKLYDVRMTVSTTNLPSGGFLLSDHLTGELAIMKEAGKILARQLNHAWPAVFKVRRGIHTWRIPMGTPSIGINEDNEILFRRVNGWWHDLRASTEQGRRQKRGSLYTLLGRRVIEAHQIFSRVR